MRGGRLRSPRDGKERKKMSLRIRIIAGFKKDADNPNQLIAKVSGTDLNVGKGTIELSLSPIEEFPAVVQRQASKNGEALDYLLTATVEDKPVASRRARSGTALKSE